jgi:crotonobetainyl-CoA:carnitine CoA-transferase CaiB-like acyl-CoA transferase
VIDLSRFLAGPFCTQLLADHGADVIKVEEPGGDPARQVGPHLPDDEERAYGGYFQSINRNKRSIVLDLKRESDRDVLRRLASSADVVVENFRAGVMERLGLSYEALAEINPRLVYVAIRGYGDPRTGRSPCVDWPSYDVIAQAAGGLVGVTGPDAGAPTRVGPSVGDLIPGLFAGFGVLSAVIEAQRSGRGQFVDVAMADGILAICERIVYRYSYGGHVSRPEGNDHPLVRPFGVFPASDGHVSIAAAFGRSWDEFCTLIGRTDLLADPRFASMELRRANSDALSEAVCAWTGSRTRAEIAAVLAGTVPFAPVNDAADVFDDAHFKARRMLVPVDHAGSALTPAIVDTPIKMTRTPGGVFRRAPRLDEHRAEVLAELHAPEVARGAAGRPSGAGKKP